MGKLQERPLGITDHLPSLLTDEDIEKPSVDVISLRPKDTKYSNQGTNYRGCHKPGLRAIEGFPGGSDGKESVCNAGDPGLILGLGRCPGKGMANHSSTLAWRIPWTEEAGGLWPMGSQTIGHN